MMAASFRNLDPKLKIYLRDHRLPDVYEALLTGLSVMCPEDAIAFLMDCLHKLKHGPQDSITWDMFIDASMRPPKKLFNDSSLDFLFNFDDDATPTPEMFALAYTHYNTSIKEKCYRSWIRFHLLKAEKNRLMEEKMESAATHHAHRLLRLRLHDWLDWTRFRKGRQAVALNKLTATFDRVFARIIFKAWQNVTVDAKKTREYFEHRLQMIKYIAISQWQMMTPKERLERGENVEEEEGFTSSTGEARDDISMLPRKVAAMIFSHLSIADTARAALVCRSWKVITQSASLFSQLDFSTIKDITEKNACKLLMKSRPYLVHLNIRGCTQFSRETYLSISECKNLQDLNISNCFNITDEMIRPVLESCRILLYLNMSNCPITDASLRTLAKNCTNLQFLSMANCTQFSGKGLYYLAQGPGAKKITYLDISGCEQINVNGYLVLAKGCSNVRYLMLNDLSNLTDEWFQPLGEHLVDLRSLSILGTPLLSDTSFKLLAKHGKLEKLRVEGNQRITDASLKMVAKSCSDLRHVYVVDCLRVSDASLKAISTCRNLAVLNMADCIKITDIGVRAIVDGPSGPNLRELNLTNCVRLGDMGLVNVHKRCHRLTYLSLCYCEHISEAGIELLGQSHSLLSLDISGCNAGDQALSSLGNNVRFRDVSLSECVAITDLGLQKFSQRCKDLERLDLSHCQQLTDGAIKNLAFCCRMLNVLNLAGCKGLTDLSMQYLSGVCHYLTTLNLSGCILLSDKSVKYLRKGCKRLRHLILLYCRGIKRPTALKMAKFVEIVEHSSEDVPGFYGY